MLMFYGCYDSKKTYYYQKIKVKNNTAPFMDIKVFNYYFKTKSSYQILIP